MCTCCTEVETAEHSLLHCQLYSTQRLELFESLTKVEQQKNQVLTLFYGSQTCNSESINQESFKNAISFLKATTRFDRPLIDF